MKSKEKSNGGQRENVTNQLPLDFHRPKDQPSKARPAEVVPLAKQRTATVRDVLVGDLIASKVPKKS